MKKRRRNPGGTRAKANPPSDFGSPFKNLKKMIAGRELSRPPAPAHPSPPPLEPPPAADDDTLLREAYAGVRRLDGAAREPRHTPVNRRVVSEEAEVMAQLSDLVSGQGRFDLTETEEYLEGSRVGIDPRLVVRLRRGEFSTQAHLDLHGMVQTGARAALCAFITESVRKGMRAVVVVTGRGLRSPGGHPVLKQAAAQWLSHGEIGAHVLAFTTARPADGGAGALYVLLRRERRRAAFDLLKGAHRRD